MLDKDDFINGISNRINTALRIAMATDPANKIFLERLNGACIHINCISPAFSLLVTIEHSEIDLNQISFKESPVSEEQKIADLTISGTAINLTKILITPMDNAAGLSEANVTVTGDVGLLLQLSQVAKMIEIDWELLLAERIGETPAVLFSRSISFGLGEFKKLHQDISENLDKKVQSDKSPVPNKHDLDKTKSELRELNYRLDRLEAKMKLHRKKA